MGTVLSFFRDGYKNVVANLGTSRDKAAFGDYSVETLSDAALATLYDGSSLPRKIVDIPALDATRKWRDWQAQGDQIEKIEAEEMRLNVRSKVQEAKAKARLFGGAAILIGDGSSNLSKPLDPERVQKGGLKYLTVLSRLDLAAGDIERDVASPYYNEPAFYRLSGQNGNNAEVHPSRLVLFNGNMMSDEAFCTTGYTGWGSSILQTAYESCNHLSGTAANVASLVFEAKIDVIRIPDFMNNLADETYETKVISRFGLAALAKGNNGTLLLDKEEEYDQKQVRFATLPDILDRFMQLVSAAADIPVTRLFGQSPAGMNATGDSDLKNYYDRISSMQTIELQPAMFVLDECIIRSALGSRPDEVHFVWASLWQITDKERAEIGKMDAETVKTLKDTALIPDVALSKSAINMLVEHSIMPGLEGHVEEFGEELPDEEDDLAASPPRNGPVEA